MRRCWPRRWSACWTIPNRELSPPHSSDSGSALRTWAAERPERAIAPARNVQGKLRGERENRGVYAAEDSGASRKRRLFRLPQPDGPDRLRAGEFRLDRPLARNRIRWL